MGSFCCYNKLLGLTFQGQEPDRFLLLVWLVGQSAVVVSALING